MTRASQPTSWRFTSRVRTGTRDSRDGGKLPGRPTRGQATSRIRRPTFPKRARPRENPEALSRAVASRIWPKTCNEGKAGRGVGFLSFLLLWASRKRNGVTRATRTSDSPDRSIRGDDHVGFSIGTTEVALVRTPVVASGVRRIRRVRCAAGTSRVHCSIQRQQFLLSPGPCPGRQNKRYQRVPTFRWALANHH